MIDQSKVYLGDAVYVSHDGYHVVLEASGNTIYLEPPVIEALINYAMKFGLKIGET